MKSKISNQATKSYKKHLQKNPHGFVYVTVPNMKEAQHISRFCLSKKWAACVNIYSPIISVYSWKGKITEEKEIVLLIKTREDLFPGLCAALAKKHSYECPCITFIPFSEGYRDFFSWMDLQLQKVSIK